jgi:hypothetical protein
MNEAASGVAEIGGLIDIIEPAAPVLGAAGNWPWIAAAVAMLVILAVAILLLLKYKLPAYRALRRLRKLRQQTLAGELTPHESVFMLALELRHGLGVKRLRAEEVPVILKPQDRSLWPEFMQQLDIMLYQRGAELDAGVLAALFAQIEKWLWRYSR